MLKSDDKSIDKHGKVSLGILDNINKGQGPSEEADKMLMMKDFMKEANSNPNVIGGNGLSARNDHRYQK